MLTDINIKNFSIICALFSCENGYLFLDEIENGIHYTQFDKLWRLILEISPEQNVQVFATTHSKEKECLKTFLDCYEHEFTQKHIYNIFYKDKRHPFDFGAPAFLN